MVRVPPKGVLYWKFLPYEGSLEPLLPAQESSRPQAGGDTKRASSQGEQQHEGVQEQEGMPHQQQEGVQQPQGVQQQQGVKKQQGVTQQQEGVQQPKGVQEQQGVAQQQEGTAHQQEGAAQQEGRWVLGSVRDPQAVLWTGQLWCWSCTWMAENSPSRLHT